MNASMVHYSCRSLFGIFLCPLLVRRKLIGIFGFIVFLDSCLIWLTCLNFGIFPMNSNWPMNSDSNDLYIMSVVYICQYYVCYSFVQAKVIDSNTLHFVFAYLLLQNGVISLGKHDLSVISVVVIVCRLHFWLLEIQTSIFGMNYPIKFNLI